MSMEVFPVSSAALLGRANSNAVTQNIANQNQNSEQSKEKEKAVAGISSNPTTPAQISFQQAQSYREMLQESKEEQDAKSKEVKDMARAQRIAARLLHGDKVPPQDEKFLMEYDMKLYMCAKTMAMTNKHPKKYDSVLEDEKKDDMNSTEDEKKGNGTSDSLVPDAAPGTDVDPSTSQDTGANQDAGTNQDTDSE